MEWQPTRWTPAQLEERRLAAARLLRAARLTQAAIARRVGVSRASVTRVTRWKRHLAQSGRRGLRRRASPGRPSYLHPAQWAQLLRLLRRLLLRLLLRLLRRLLRGSAVVAGVETERWTLRRIAAVVERTFGVRYQPRSLRPALRARGWSPQIPIARARERAGAGGSGTTRWSRRGSSTTGRESKKGAPHRVRDHLRRRDGAHLPRAAGHHWAPPGRRWGSHRSCAA